MANTFRAQRVNPRLGAYFGIVTSLIAALFLVLLVLEQLGTTDTIIRTCVLVGPPVLFAAIGILSTTRVPLDFFAVGRRVPAICSGLVLAITAIGSTGFLAWTGALYVNGFDAWCIVSGGITGFLIMGIAIAPYYRKSGAYTLPTFLARRFQSRLLRLTAATVFIVPLLLLLTAELTTTVWAAELLVGPQPAMLTFGIAAVVLATIAFGGMRGLTWVSTAQAITAILAIVVLAAMVGVMLTNFPVSQLSFGPVLRAIGRLEHAQQIPISQAPAYAFDIVGMDFEPLRSRAATPFQSVGIFGHALANIMIAAGIAAGPWLLPRNGTTVSVYDARKSLAWAVFFFGFIAVTLAALAIFVRHFAMTDLVGRAATDLPEWFTALRDLGLAAIGKGETVLGLSSFAIKRDAVLAALPLAAGAPPIVLYLVLAGVVAAGLAAIAATSHTIAALLSEDVVTGLRWDPPADAYRLGIKRVMAVLVVLVGMAFVAIVETDPLRLVFWALGITASTAFPVVILSVWWKRLTPTGAIAAIGTGFLVAVMSILMSGYELLSVPSELAASLGIAPAFVAAILASRATVLPAREVLEQVRDMRVPGGETVYDREMRLLRQRQLTSRS